MPKIEIKTKGLGRAECCGGVLLHTKDCKNNPENLRKNAWIQTFTGKKFYPLQPKIEDICIEDIAHSLSMQCRYNGHCKQFYSVAQHSAVIAQMWFDGDIQLERYALLHDASEAYLSDIPRPLKLLPEFAFYRNAEKKLQSIIFERFGLEPNEPEEIKKADYEILCQEAMSEEIMSPLHSDWSAKAEKRILYLPVLTPKQSEIYFIEQFLRLFGHK